MPMSRIARSGAVRSVSRVLAAGVVAAGLSAQQPSSQPAADQQTPVFRGGVNFVSVDAYPRRDGTVVEGLTAADFQVLEDGAPQKVETFEFIRIAPNPLDADRRDPTSQREMAQQARDPKTRVFVVYLDMLHTTFAGTQYARRPIVDFLTRTIGKTDLFGYMTAEIPVSHVVFGRRTETIESELQRFWAWGQADLKEMAQTPAEDQIVNCALTRSTPDLPLEKVILRLWREDMLMTSLENLMDRLRDLRDERKSILFISEGWQPRGPREDLIARLADRPVSRGTLPRVGVGPGGRLGIDVPQGLFDIDLRDCAQRIDRLIHLDFQWRFQELLGRARRANVTFYPVDVGGLAVDSGLEPTGTLRTLADQTDGLAVTGTNDLDRGVRRISEHLSSFYLLGYYSTNPAADGRFRNIEVTVDRPGIKVSARRGYLAPSAAVMATRPLEAAPGPTEVDEAFGQLAALRPTADLFVHGAMSVRGLDVTVEWAASAMAGRGARETPVDIAAVSTATGRRVAATIAIAAGERSVRVTLAEANAADGPWRLVARASRAEGLIEASAEVHRVTANLIGAATAFRGTGSARVPPKPLADLRLSRTERLRVEWPIVDAAATRVARLLDRKGQPLGAALPVTDRAADHAVASVDVPLSALPEGDFAVELTAARGDVTERRLLAFRVVR